MELIALGPGFAAEVRTTISATDADGVADLRPARAAA